MRRRTTVRVLPLIAAFALALAGTAGGGIGPAFAWGTDSTLPSQCAADDHPAGCWGNVQNVLIMNNFTTITNGCPNGDTITRTLASKDAVQKKITAAKYAHYWMIPQGQAAVMSLLFITAANAELSCAAAISDPTTSQRLHGSATELIYLAADWARTAGSATRFQQYSTQFFTEVNALINNAGADQWARERAFWSKHFYCTAENPDVGPENPDYGRLFTWDDFHNDGCDLYRYD